MAANQEVINEWIYEYRSLKEDDIKGFAAEHEHNHEIATAVFNLLYSQHEDAESPEKKPHDQESIDKLLENVCIQLFSFYRSKEVELQRFTLQFVPTLIYSYLSTVAQNKKNYRCIETLLIGLYNFEVVDEMGKPKVVSFRLPSLAQASIYHEPMSLGAQFLTENALRRWEECNTKLVTWGPFPQVENINAQNRLKVMAALLFIYNQEKYMLPQSALRHFCIAASRIVTQGYPKDNQRNSRRIQRIPVSSNLLLEMIEGVYFAMYNDFYTLALQAVNDIDLRAQYELLPDVMLVTGALLNALEDTTSGQPSDGPLDISAALPPVTATTTMSKSMITNASFRTKKLPDDIPIQAGQAAPAPDPAELAAITEEGDDGALSRGNVRSSKPKFPILGKKKDSKDKASDKKVTLKDTTKGSSIWNSLGGGGGDSADSQPKSSADSDANGKDDKISMSSVPNSTENSDTRSLVTTDSLEIDATTPRFAAMQVSSV